jgi:hypothetical protein
LNERYVILLPSRGHEGEWIYEQRHFHAGKGIFSRDEGHALLPTARKLVREMGRDPRRVRFRPVKEKEAGKL